MNTGARRFACLFSTIVFLIAAFLSSHPARAAGLTVEQARERCRETAGREFVQACVRNQGKDHIEACRAAASPKVMACVTAALNAANGRANVPLAVPTEAAPSAKEVAAVNALPAGFVAPPRTIADITAILDSEKPDAKKIAELKSSADVQPPQSASREELARFYYSRGSARAQLGRLSESVADANKAVENGQGAANANLMSRLIQFAGLQYSLTGDPKKALAVFSHQAQVANAPGAKGFLFGANRQIAAILLQMGDIAQADAYLRRSTVLIQEARTSGLPSWRSSYAAYGQSWESDLEATRSIILEARGQFREAEASFRLAEQRRLASVKGLMSQENPPPLTQILLGIDVMVLGQARMKARQGRLAEAEADARRALLARLKDQGKYNPNTPRFIMGLADILVEEGRYSEAEQLARVCLEINLTVGIADDSQGTASVLSHLASILNLQRKTKEAAAVYAQLDKAIANWEPQRRQGFDLNGSRINSLYASGQIEAGIVAARELVKRQVAKVGEKHFDTAAARGTLAVGLMRAGQDADAAREFKAAIPILMASARENADDDDTTVVAARSQRLQNIVEAYIQLQARTAQPGGDTAVETFALADSIRGQSVQKALSASSARSVAKDPALAELVRKEQDLTKQVNAQLGLLNNVLSLPAAERDEKGVREITASIGKLRGERDKARQEIRTQFRDYASLVDPTPPTVDDVRAVLRADEAFVSFYFGRERSFVWAVPKVGPVSFASIPLTAGDMETKVRALREALEPQAATIAEIPAFDLGLAHELYTLLLRPVEDGWRPAKSLLVVTNGALGLLPLGVLTTAPSDLNMATETPFTGYRSVPWLARTHAVTIVPSAAALRTLRQLPPASAKRETVIGFGDPYFNEQQATEAEQPQAQDIIQVSDVTMRGLPLKRRSVPQTRGVDSADLGLLPRLPDTRDELQSIAVALEADPAKVLRLGKDANEQVVKATDLSKYRIIVFATHGLVAGDLNGLTQPALALTAPSVAGTSGDGLLTMEKILALKLDADWVVLSACNTAAGAGAGAEAASGLGRAFFYAGTRAILVTNWSVHSASARELVSDLFHRQSIDSKMTRGEALRQASMALLDGSGFSDPSSGKMLFSYAHPIFWAPYTIIGDGGGTQ
jgi:CHAT domain-containing protein/tetratricopeptide (TPR) repeat protein